MHLNACKTCGTTTHSVMEFTPRLRKTAQARFRNRRQPVDQLSQLDALRGLTSSSQVLKQLIAVISSRSQLDFTPGREKACGDVHWQWLLLNMQGYRSCSSRQLNPQCSLYPKTVSTSEKLWKRRWKKASVNHFPTEGMIMARCLNACNIFSVLNTSSNTSRDCIRRKVCGTKKQAFINRPCCLFVCLALRNQHTSI